MHGICKGLFILLNLRTKNSIASGDGKLQRDVGVLLSDIWLRKDSLFAVNLLMVAGKQCN